jgi:YHS domain-containing protein
MSGLLLKLILFLVVARLIWRFVRGVLEGAGFYQVQSHPSVGLVRDPVCGVFVVPSQALVARKGSETKYFCSEKCRKAWNG